MFDNMQISVVGGQQEEMKSEAESSENESGDDAEDAHFQEDVNKVSQKHQRLIDVEDRDREDSPAENGRGTEGVDDRVAGRGRETGRRGGDGYFHT